MPVNPDVTATPRRVSVDSLRRSENKIGGPVQAVESDTSSLAKSMDVLDVPTTYTYMKKQHIMTKYERYFYRRLHHMFGKHYLIFPQIHLDDLFDHRKIGQNWRGALSTIQRKSVDFVICSTDCRILLAIELDDASHENEDRMKRDKLVDHLFEQAGSCLIRFSNVEGLTDDNIKEWILRGIREFNTNLQ